MENKKQEEIKEEVKEEKNPQEETVDEEEVVEDLVDERDEKIIAIPFKDPSMCMYEDILDIPAHIFAEISHFFEVYKILENKKTAIKEIDGREAAIECIEKCMKAYDEKFINK